MTFRSVSSAMHTHCTVDKHIAVSSVALTTESSVRSTRSSSEWRHLRDSLLVCLRRTTPASDAVTLSSATPVHSLVSLIDRVYTYRSHSRQYYADAASSHSRHLQLPLTSMAFSPDHVTSVIDGFVQTTANEMDQAEWLMKRFVTEFREGLYTYREGKSATLIGIYVLLFIASSVGNIAVLKFVLPFRRMRSVTHYFIINLAAADLLRTSVSLSVYTRQSVISSVSLPWLI